MFFYFDKGYKYVSRLWIAKGHYVTSAAFNKNDLLAAASTEHAILIWNVTTRQRIKSLYSNNVTSLAFNKADILASGSKDNSIKLWNIVTGAVLKTLWGHKSRIDGLVYVTNNVLASVSRDSTVKLWNVPSGTLLRTLFEEKSDDGFFSFSISVSFEPFTPLIIASNNNKILAVGTTRIELYDLNGRVWSLEVSKVESLAFNGGNLLASGLGNGAIKLWNINSRQEVKTLTGHWASVCSLAFNSDNILASGSRDESIKLWNITTGEVLKTLWGHKKSEWHIPSGRVSTTPLQLVFSKNNLLASFDDEHPTIKLWSE